MRTLTLALYAAGILGATAPVAAQSTPDSDQPLLGFGRSVAAGTDHVFVGEPLNELTSGAVYVFGRNAAEWTEIQRLTAPEPTMGDRFGYAIASDGRVLVTTSLTGRDERGVAYLYTSDGTGWALAAQLTAEGGAPGDSLGIAVALSGSRLAVGSARRGGTAGPVYLFERDGTSWPQTAVVVAPTAQPGDGFGEAVALDGDILVVGAPSTGDGVGSAYVFRRAADGSWRQEARLESLAPEEETAFGTAVAVSGGTVLVGAPEAGEGIGAVFTYERDADGTWELVSPLFPFDGSPRTEFGSALAFDGSEAWIGAPGADREGRVYLFHRSEGAWTDVTKLMGDDVDRGDNLAGTLATNGDLAVVGLLGDDYGAGTAMVFERDGRGWTAAGKILGEGEAISAIVGETVACEDGVASLFDCSQMNLLSFLPVSALGGARGVRLNDIWGWTDPQTGREYALVGRTDGTSFVDVTDASNPQYLGNLPKTDGAPGSTWRDIKVYRNHAYIVADGAQQHGMQVFDLTQLRDVDGSPVTFTETAHYDRIASAHNIVINENTGFAFAVGASAGGDTCGGGLHMIDIREPAQPTFAGCFADPATGRRRTGYTHDAQCVSYHGPDTEHQGKEICLGANETALSIADVSDKDNPVALAMASYPNVGYTHQGWLTEDQRYFFMNDELDELGGSVPSTRTLIWDVTDLDDPILVKEHFSDNQASDHNLYIRDHLMYQSNYLSGLRVLDISDVENPVEVGFFDTVPYGEDEPGFGGSWSNYPFFESGIVVVTSGREGIFVVKKRATEIIP